MGACMRMVFISYPDLFYDMLYIYMSVCVCNMLLGADFEKLFLSFLKVIFSAAIKCSEKLIKEFFIIKNC